MSKNENIQKNNLNTNLISQEENFDKMLNINNNQNNNNNNSLKKNSIKISNNNDQQKNLIANDLFSIKYDDDKNNESILSNININQLQKVNSFSNSKNNDDSEIDQNQRINFANDLFNSSCKTFTLAGSQNNVGSSSFSMQKKEMADELFGISPSSSYKGSIRSANQSNMSHAILNGSNIGLNLNEIANKYALRDQIIKEDLDEDKIASPRLTEENINKKKEDSYYADVNEEMEEDFVFKKNIASFENNVFSNKIKFSINYLDNKQIENSKDIENNKKKNNDLLRNSFEPNQNNEKQNEDEKDDNNENNENNEKNGSDNISNSIISIGGINIDELPKFHNNNKIENVKNNNKEEKIDNINDNMINTENNLEIGSKIESKIDSKVDSKIESKISKIDSKKGSKISKIDSKRGSKISKIDSKRNSKISKIDSKRNSKKDSKRDSKKDSKISKISKIDSKISKIDPKIDSKVESKINSKIESNSKIDSNIDSKIDSKIESKKESKLESKEEIKQQKENHEKPNLKNLFRNKNNIKKMAIDKNPISIKNNKENNINENSNAIIDKDSDNENSNDILLKKLKTQQENKNKISKLKKGIEITDYSVNEDNKSNIIENLNAIDTMTDKNKTIELNNTENNDSKIEISSIKKKKKIIIEDSNKKDENENEDDEKFLLIDINSIKNEKSFVEYLSNIDIDFYFNKNIINDNEQIENILSNTYFGEYILKNETIIDIILSKKSKIKIDIPYYYTTINDTYNKSKNIFKNIFQYASSDDKKIFQQKFEQSINAKNNFFDINNLNICPCINDINDFKTCFLIESSENENYFFDYIRYVVEKDGDSFYRCIMFNLFEKCILNEKKDTIFMFILDIFKLYDLSPKIYTDKNVNVKNILIFFCILIEYIELKWWEKAYYFFIYLYNEIDQALIIYLRYSIFFFLTKIDFRISNNINTKYLNQFMLLISHYEPSSKIVFQSIPYIFGVNVDIKFYEGKCGKNFFSNVKNILFTCDKNLKKRNIDIISLFFYQNSYHIIYKNIKNNLILKNLNKISPVNYSLLLDSSKFCNMCNKNNKCVKIDYISQDEFLCYDCLLNQIEIQLNKRISLLNKETNKNYSYYLRPIEILLQSYIKTKNNISTNIINISNHDFIHLYQKNFNERIAELIQAKDRLVSINNINNKNENSDVKEENTDICFLCGKNDNVFQSECGCKFCDDCALNMLLELTNQKIILNGYEKIIYKSNNYNKLEYECSNCAKNININLIILFLEQSGKDFSEYYEDAKDRMKKYCQSHCFSCEKAFSNERNIEVEHNRKKFFIRFNVIINDYCFKRGKASEYEKDIDYSNTQHSLCYECFRKMIVKRRNGSHIKTLKNKDYQVIKCNICGIKHFIDQEEWDEYDKNNTCCKCGIF